jgi:hypothetical protein
MYEFVLTLHSWLRWAAIPAGIVATIAAFTVRPGYTESTRADRWGLILTIVLDLQLVLGLLLYVALSPTTAAVFEDFGAAMGDPVARFWAVEHIALMLAAVVVAHVGRILGRKARTPNSKRIRLLVCFALATVVMIAATPWPGMPAGRPLFRL